MNITLLDNTYMSAIITRIDEYISLKRPKNMYFLAAFPHKLNSMLSRIWMSSFGQIVMECAKYATRHGDRKVEK